MKLKKIIEKGYKDKYEENIKKPVFEHYINFSYHIVPQIRMNIILRLCYTKNTYFHPKFKQFFKKEEFNTYRKFPWITPLLFYCLFYCTPFFKTELLYFNVFLIFLEILVFKKKTYYYKIFKNFYYFTIYFATNEALRFKTK